MPTSRDHRSSPLLLAGVLAASLALSLTVVEFALRLLSLPPGLPSPPAPSTIDPYEANPYIVSYRPTLQEFIPGSRYQAKRPSYVVDYRVNAHGRRGPAIGPKTDRRLVVLGDSIVEGHGVPFEETFASKLDAGLAPSGWSVASAAIQGASPIHHAANAAQTLALEPDAVMIVLYENDLWDDRMKERAYFDLPPRPEVGPSRLWALVRSLLPPSDDDTLERTIRENRDSPPPERDPDPLSPVVIDASVFDSHWTKSEPYLDHLADTLEKHDVPLLVTVFALGTLVPRAPAAHGVHARNLETAARRWAERRGLPFLSLYPVTEAALSELPWEQVLLPDDGHPTGEIHTRIADRLGPWLGEQLAR